MGGKTKSLVNIWHTALFVIVLVLLALYVFLVNSIAGDNFEIENLSKKTNELNEQNAAMEAQASHAQSLSALQENSKALGLQEAVRVNYIKTKSSEPLVLRN